MKTISVKEMREIYAQTPIYAGSETTTREVIADCGVWKRTSDCQDG